MGKRMSKAARMHPLPDGRMVEDKTGEIHDFRENANDRILVVIQQRRKHKERFVMMWDDSLRAIGMDKDLRGRPMAVLIYIMGSLDFENYVAITQADLSRALDIAPPNVSTAFKLLVQKGILQEGPPTGRTHSYRLNSHYGWKGTPISLDKRRREEDKPSQIDFEGNLHTHPIPVN